MALKNLRLLGLEESPNRQPDIHEMIRDLRKEIAKGEAVYSKDELACLEKKLDEHLEMLRVITISP
jgi:hypothetical protein